MSKDINADNPLYETLELIRLRYYAVVKIIKEFNVDKKYFDDETQTLKMSDNIKVQDGRPYFKLEETQDPKIIQKIADTLLKMQYKFLDEVVSDDVEANKAETTRRLLGIINYEDKVKLVNMSDEMTLLYYAAQEGSYDVVDALIKNGADVNKQDAEGDTALHAVVANSDSDEVKKIAIASLLLVAGARNIANNDRKTPLQNVRQKDKSLLQLLREFQQYEGMSPLLHNRVQKLRRERAEDGLRSTEPNDFTKKLSKNPIHKASHAKSAEEERFEASIRIKEYLAKRKYDRKTVESITDSYFIRDGEIFLNSNHESALGEKVKAQILDQLFLEQQNFFREEFNSDLRDQSRLESAKIFDLIHLQEDREKIINFSGLKKVTNLHRAAYECHISAVEFLLQNGADVNAIDAGGLNAFNYSEISIKALSQPEKPLQQIVIRNKVKVVTVEGRKEINGKDAIRRILMSHSEGAESSSVPSLAISRTNISTSPLRNVVSNISK